MGMFSFIKGAGDRLFGKGKTEEQAIKEHCEKLGLDPSQVNITFKDGHIVAVGRARNAEDREKLILAMGNVEGVNEVQEEIVIVTEEVATDGSTSADATEQSADAAADSTFYTVQKGDTLGAIAKAHYGNAGLYPKIFEANKPMLSDPNKIYPGQMLRIPPR